MKKTFTVIILIVFCQVLTAQTSIENINKLIISYSGDSTLLTEKYEINIKKEKIYYITPVINYLDISKKKYRTRIKIKKQNWKEIIPLINSLTPLTLEPNNKKQDGKVIYTIGFSRENKEQENFQFYKEQAPNELIRLFKIIRNKK